MSQASRSRTPAIVRIFGTILKAWWDDDALRLGAALAYLHIVCDRASHPTNERERVKFPRISVGAGVALSHTLEDRDECVAIQHRMEDT